ncbi:MAG: sigma-70 family RNA polymerase sigma factor [Eubacterium sp.]|nr:sigma-70 family RNA polymerase sigma factor [Eubacterium sp.]
MKKRDVSFDNYIDLLREKDERALDFVIDEYGGLIMSVIRHLLGGFPEEQEECFNDSLMKIWEHSEDYNEDLCEFRGWVAAIARYQAIDRLRRIKRDNERRVLQDFDEMSENSSKDEEAFQRIEETIDDEIGSMLECLSPGDRELFRRLYVEGESAKEVGEKLDISESNVYSRASRGRKKLRLFLKDRRENEYGR